MSATDGTRAARLDLDTRAHGGDAARAEAILEQMRELHPTGQAPHGPGTAPCWLAGRRGRP